MRNIKFRAFDLDEKKMKTVNSVDFTNELITVYDKESLEHVLSFEDVELMQYTNFNDKNNTEIYDGDIIKFKYPIDRRIIEKYFVIYSNEQASYVLTKGEETDRVPLYHLNSSNYMEVIGNIYENKELLKCK